MSNMQVIYYGEEMPYRFSKSVFLCGPSFRTGQEGESWRKDALQILQDIGFDNGVVFVPENRDGKLDENHNYNETVSWEQKHLDICDVALFWVPRDLETLPAFTTNLEYGHLYTSGRVVLGFPEDTPKMKYLEYCAKQNNIPVSHSLTETIQNALDLIGEGSERVNGERYIPLKVWNTPSFQKWHKAQTKAGNRIETAKVEYTFGKKFGGQIFLWVLQPTMYIPSEDRYKSDEVIVSRPDISSVCMYARVDEDIEVVLVKEFRSACSNGNYLYELPSGHTPGEQEDAKETAISEVHEECGFDLEEERLKYVGSRQLAGTLSTHKSHLFSYELNKDELEWFKAQKDITHGNTEEGERTYIEVVKLSSILEDNLLDWTNVGELYAAINKE